MRVTRSRAARAVLVVGALGILLLATAALLAPVLVARAHVRERVAAELSKQLGTPVELAALRLSLLPLPHVVAEGLHISVEPSVRTSIDSLTVYPQLRALFTGNLQLARVTVSGATAEVRLREHAPEPATPKGDVSIHEVRAALGAALGQLASVAAARAPGLRLDLEHVAATIVTGGQMRLSLTDVHGSVQLPPDELRIDLRGGSNLWDEASLSAGIDPRGVRGDARLRLIGARVQLIAAGLLPADLEITGGTATVEAQIRTDGIDVLHADVEAALPALPLRRGGKEFTLAGARVKAGVVVQGDAIEATLHDIQLTNPPAQLAAKVSVDPSIPHAQFVVEGRSVDVARAHDAALFFAATNRAARAIFNVLQAGQVSHITVQAQAGTPAELGSLHVIQIRGALTDGTIRLPGSGLELSDVSGEVSVLDGVLDGEHAVGRVGNTRASDGSVRVGLQADPGELSVRTAVHADVRDLPPVLRRLVNNETLMRTLDYVTDLQGNADGTLSLGGTTDDATAEVEVPTLSLAFGLRGLERGVRVEGGTFHYDPAGITANGLQLSSAGSTLADVSVGVDLQPKAATIDIGSGTGRIILRELYPWVVSSGWLPASPWTPETLSGTVNVSSVRIRGPASFPNQWRIDVNGAAERLEGDVPGLRQTVAVRLPVSLSELRVSRDANILRVGTAATFADGMKVSVDLVRDPSTLDVKQLVIRDDATSATISLKARARVFDLGFKGTLDTTVLKTLVREAEDVPREVRGDFQTHVLLDEPTKSTANGQLEMEQVVVPLSGDVSLHVSQATLRASGGMLAVDAEGDLRDAARVHVHGAVRPGQDAFIADLDVSAGDLEWNRLAALIAAASPGQDAGSSSKVPLRGKVRIDAESFAYGGYRWRPVHAVVNLSGSAYTLNVTQATLCGIGTPATIATAPVGVSFLVKPTAKNQPFDSVWECLFGDARVSGQCNLSGQIAAAGEGAGIARSAQGHLEFSAAQGRIYQGGWIQKVLAVMSIGYGSWNILKDLTDDGLPYNTIHIKGDLRDSKLVLTEATMDAPSMKMAAEGSIDIGAQTLSLTLLAAPLKTVDTIVSHIPILGGVLGGSLLTIPIKVDGPVRDPSVTALDPSAVGSGVMRMMTRIVKLPLNLLTPILPSEKTP